MTKLAYPAKRVIRFLKKPSTRVGEAPGGSTGWTRSVRINAANTVFTKEIPPKEDLGKSFRLYPSVE